MRFLKNDDLDALIEAAPLGIIVFDSTPRIIRWNPAAERIFGWKESEVIGSLNNPVLPEGHDEEYEEMRKRLLGGGSNKGDEFIRKRKDGTFLNVRAYSSHIKDKDGKVLGVVAMYDDITEQKKEHDKLVWNELLLRQMTESSRYGFYLADNRTGEILYCNKRFLQIWGIEPETNINELTNDNLVNLCSEKVIEKDRYLPVIKALNDINNESVIEDEIILRGGVSLKYYTTPLKDGKSNYLGRFFLFEDISERKLYEALLKSEDEYIKLVESSPEAILVANRKGEILICNDIASSLLGKQKELIKNNTLQKILNIDKYIGLNELSLGKTVSFNNDIESGNSKAKNIVINARLQTADKIHVTIYEHAKNKTHTDNSFSGMQNRFIFASDKMKRINFEITRLANLDFDILLEGETGTGKDLIAVQVHQRGNRRNYPFVSVPISTLNESLVESELFGHEKGAFSGADRQKIGKFEAANKGILYIPEISSLPEIIQLKLLNFMQYKTISRVGQDARKGEIKLDVRLIMATNENLEELVKAGKFRKDFYYRISGTKIIIPPLSERIEDIRVLAKYFIELYGKNFPGKKFELSDAAIELLTKYDWPGNIRELANCIKNVLSYNTGPLIEPEHFQNILNLKNKFLLNDFTSLYGQAAIAPDFHIAETEFKKAYFKNLLELSNNKISEAAKIAGLTPQGLRKALNKLGM